MAETDDDRGGVNSFHPQAYLMYLVSNNPEALRDDSAKLTPGTENTSVHRLGGPYKPQDVMSKVYNTRDASGKKLIKAHFFNLETHKLTSLVPEVRFYKIDGRTGAKTTEELLTPFFFPVSALSDEAATSTGFSRLKASGVQSFTVTYQGTDPFTAPKYLSANVSLFVDNLANIFDTREGFAPLADMFTISIPKGTSSSENGSATVVSGDLSRPIEVVATLGYADPGTRFLLEEEIEEIKEANITLRMNVIHHSIDVSQDGSATISIKYTARIDNTLNDKVFSATDSPVNILKRADIRQLLEEGGTDMSKLNGKKSKAGSGYKNQIQKMAQIRQIMEIVEQKKRIFEIETDPGSLGRYSTLGYDDQKLKDYERYTNSQTTKKDNNSTNRKQKEASNPSPPQETIVPTNQSGKDLFERIKALDNYVRSIHYVLFGDLRQAFFERTKNNLEETKSLIGIASEARLIQMVATGRISELDKAYIMAISKKKAKEKAKIIRIIQGAIEKLKTFKVLLPRVRYKYVTINGDDNSAVDYKEINIADVPISLEIYQAFMYQKIVNSYRNTYTIPAFLNECVHTLLPMAFGSTFSATGIAPAVIDEAPSFTSSTFSGPRIRGDLANKSDLDPVKHIPGGTSLSPTKIDDACDYFVIYQNIDKVLASDKGGDLDEDSKNGIYHFQIGKNRGLIKEITFSRFDVPYAQEQLMTNQVGQYDELKMPYKADIQMFGNNLFMPGSQIFIDPSNIGFGNPRDPISPAYKLGLGGYYTVISVETGYQGGVMTTTLGCSFGSHARIEKERTETAKVETKIETINTPQVSNDSEPNEIPADLQTAATSGNNFETRIQQLRTPGRGDSVADAPLARAISNDYVLHKNTIINRIPGVIDKEINPFSGAVRYNLVTGFIIEIDPSRGDTDSVRLVTGEGHSKYRSSGT